jgi:hypothetical protein
LTRLIKKFYISIMAVDNYEVIGFLSVALEEIAEKERLKAEEEARKRLAAEERENWANSAFDFAHSIIRSRGSIRSKSEGVSRHNGEFMTQYWHQSKPVPITRGDQTFNIWLVGDLGDEYYSPYNDIKSIDIQASEGKIPERVVESEMENPRGLFTFTRFGKATCWAGEVTPTYRIFAESLLRTLDQNLPRR